MTDPLTTYLHDHLAAALFAIELLEMLRDRHRDQPLGSFAATLFHEIEADREVLQNIVDHAGGGKPVVREAVSWLGQKASEFKLDPSPLGTFETLETLALGIEGKLKLWRALAAIARLEPRVRGIDYDQLAARAQAQHAQLEESRMEAAAAAFAPAAS